MKFKDLAINDVFNLKVGRYKKVDSQSALCIFSGMDIIGKIYNFEPELDVLYIGSENDAFDFNAWCARLG